MSDTGRSPEYSRDDCIEWVQSTAWLLDRSPSLQEYRDHKSLEAPAADTLIDRFGSWNAVKAAADLETVPAGRPPTYSDDDCRRALRQVTQQLGHPPSANEYRDRRLDTMPSATTIIHHFDTWANVQARLDDADTS